MTLRRLSVPALAALSVALWTAPLPAQDKKTCASAADRACIAQSIVADTASINDASWRDQALRDVASSLTYDGKVDAAIALIPKISNGDTQAMTIRGIGMTAALYGKETKENLRIIFGKLAKAALAIRDPNANAIAVTYIAMAQAFAGLDDDAWATAAGMTNMALQHKAYAESAEIQAERGDFAAATKSIQKIGTASFRNKAYQSVAKILIKKDRLDDALAAAQAIDNPMKRAQTMQDILKAQEEKTRGPRNDMGTAPAPAANAAGDAPQ